MGAYVDDCVTIWFSVDTGFDYASKTVTIESRFTPSLNCFGGSVESIKSLTGFSDGVEVIKLKSLILAQIERWRHA